MNEKILFDWLYADIEELIDFDISLIKKEDLKNDREQYAEACDGITRQCCDDP